MTTSPTLPHGLCRNSECSVANGGTVCALEHIDLLECPDFEPIEDEAAPVTSEPEEERSGPIDVRGRSPITSRGETVAVYSADTLTIDEATGVLRHRPATVIVPIGAVGVGKSTLLGALWEHVSSTPTSGWVFAESLTPYGFEDRCFLASFGSDLPRPQQPRTSENTDRIFLHFAVCHSVDPSTTRHDFLLADISGEHAAKFVNAGEPGPLLSLLRSAHVVAILADGDELASPSTRWAVVNGARVLARVILERIELRSDVKIVLVVTKWDRCAAVVGIDAVVSRLEDEVRAAIPNVVLLKMAARSEDEDVVAEGTGLADFLLISLEDRPVAKSMAFESPASSRRFSAFVAGSPVLDHLSNRHSR
jgi:double-GTPase-like protein